MTVVAFYMYTVYFLVVSHSISQNFVYLFLFKILKIISYEHFYGVFLHNFDCLCEIKSSIKYLLLLELSMRNNRSKVKHIIIV